MKLFHLSDLHLGKRVNEFSMLEDQKYILAQILGIVKDEQPDGVILAGDIYDKAVPSAEAVQVFDCFPGRALQTQIFLRCSTPQTKYNVLWSLGAALI